MDLKKQSKISFTEENKMNEYIGLNTRSMDTSTIDKMKMLNEKTYLIKEIRDT